MTIIYVHPCLAFVTFCSETYQYTVNNANFLAFIKHANFIKIKLTNKSAILTRQNINIHCA